MSSRSTARPGGRRSTVAPRGPRARIVAGRGGAAGAPSRGRTLPKRVAAARATARPRRQVLDDGALRERDRRDGERDDGGLGQPRRRRDADAHGRRLGKIKDRSRRRRRLISTQVAVYAFLTRTCGLGREDGWRLAFLLPAFITGCVAFALRLCSDDSPRGDLAALYFAARIRHGRIAATPRPRRGYSVGASTATPGPRSGRFWSRPARAADTGTTSWRAGPRHGPRASACSTSTRGRSVSSTRVGVQIAGDTAAAARVGRGERAGAGTHAASASSSTSTTPRRSTSRPWTPSASASSTRASSRPSSAG